MMFVLSQVSESRPGAPNSVNRFRKIYFGSKLRAIASSIPFKKLIDSGAE